MEASPVSRTKHDDMMRAFAGRYISPNPGAKKATSFVATPCCHDTYSTNGKDIAQHVLDLRAARLG